MSSFVKANKNHWFRQICSFYKNYTWRFIIIIILSVVAAGVNALSIVFTGDIYNNYLNDNVSWGSEILAAFLFICGGLLICFIISNVVFLIAGLLLVDMSEKTNFKLRNYLFKYLQSLPVKYFDQNGGGKLLTSVANDIDNISIFMSQNFATVIYQAAAFLATLITMFFVSWELTLIVMIVIPILVIVDWIIVKKIKPLFAKQQQEISDINGFIEEAISGTKTIINFNQQEKKVKQFKVINDSLTKHATAAQTASNVLMPINIFIDNLSFVILAALGISLILTGAIDANSGINIIKDPSAYTLLITFTIFARNLTNPISEIASTASSFFFAIAGAKRVSVIINEAKEKDAIKPLKIKEINGSVELRNLNFGYEPGQKVLKDINFKCKPGTSVAIVGPTGSGKTTIVNLITKFYPINDNEIFVDGNDINQLSNFFLRKNITMVLQDTFLFADTIMENLRYGRLDATDEEIYAAAKLADADHFIRQMPNGYKTKLSDNGSNLSQGQRQQLAIARAFLANPKIVILDEATSSIDTNTEIQISKAMLKLMKGRTSFIIAHRLSTIKKCDVILVLKDGKIIEKGKHKELIDKKGFYAEMYYSQFKGKQW